MTTAIETIFLIIISLVITIFNCFQSAYEKLMADKIVRDRYLSIIKEVDLISLSSKA